MDLLGQHLHPQPLTLPDLAGRGDVVRELLDSLRDQLSLGQVAGLTQELTALARNAKKWPVKMTSWDSEKILERILPNIECQHLGFCGMFASSCFLRAVRLPEDSKVLKNAAAMAKQFVQALNTAPLAEVEGLLENSHHGHLGLLGDHGTGSAPNLEQLP